jgi:TfoX/Sxy family transcriptional regulator of competence genes
LEVERIVAVSINLALTDRVRELLADTRGVQEKKMFRGITFMVNKKMCVTCGDDELMCRIDPSVYTELVTKPGVRAMVMRGKELKGYLFVKEDQLKTARALGYWIGLALDYNKKLTLRPKSK